MHNESPIVLRKENVYGKAIRDELAQELPYMAQSFVTCYQPQSTPAFWRLRVPASSMEWELEYFLLLSAR